MRRVMVVVDEKHIQFFDGNNIDVIDTNLSSVDVGKLIIRQIEKKGDKPHTIGVFMRWQYWRYLDIPNDKQVVVQNAKIEPVEKTEA
jgi:hypothetical protein